MSGLRISKSRNVTINYDKNKYNSGYLPLNPNPDEPLPVIPIQGFGDMLKAIYDTNNNGKVDSVDYVDIATVGGLQDILNDLQSGSGGSSSTEFVTVTNNGPDVFQPGMPVCQEGSIYRLASSLAPKHNFLGLAVGTSYNGDSLKIQTAGVMSLSVSAWDLVTRMVGGLVTNKFYYLSSGSTLVSSSDAPQFFPEYLVKVGMAISPTRFFIDPDMAIKL